VKRSVSQMPYAPSGATGKEEEDGKDKNFLELDY
jgi:hypothetical protein